MDNRSMTAQFYASEIMRIRKINQTQLGALADIPQSTLSRVIKEGGSGLRSSALINLMKLYNESMNATDDPADNSMATG